MASDFDFLIRTQSGIIHSIMCTRTWVCSRSKYLYNNMLTIHARTNIHLSSAHTWTLFHHPLILLVRNCLPFRKLKKNSILGIVNTFLSWSFLAPLSRLTFCTYLIHLHMMFIFHFGRGDVMEFGQYLMVSKA